MKFPDRIREPGALLRGFRQAPVVKEQDPREALLIAAGQVLGEASEVHYPNGALAVYRDRRPEGQFVITVVDTHRNNEVLIAVISALTGVDYAHFSKGPWGPALLDWAHEVVEARRGITCPL